MQIVKLISFLLLLLHNAAVATASDEYRCPFSLIKYGASSIATSDVSRGHLRTPPFQIRPATVSLVTDHSLDPVIADILRDYDLSRNPSSHSTLDKFENNVPGSDSISKLKCGISPPNCYNDTNNLRYRRLDGACNNLLFTDFGMAKSRYARLLRPQYGDGQDSPTASRSGATLPSARVASLSLYGEDRFGDQYRTMAAMQWGQFVAHDISMLSTNGSPSDCCDDYNHKQCYPMPLALDGPMSYMTGKTCLNFARATSDADAICPKSYLPYHEKISIVTAYLDLSSLYGNTLDESSRVRLHKSGLLKTSYVNNQNWMPIVRNAESDETECGQQEKCYLLPDRRNRFTPIIATLHTLLLREHNRIAVELSRLNPHYSDERLYQEARKINIGQYQKITYNDWLPLIVGDTFAYSNGLLYFPEKFDQYINDYDDSVSAAPLAEFAQAAFRYSHAQIPGWFSLVSPNSDSNQTLRLSDYFGRESNIDLLASNDNFDALLRGLAMQVQKRSDWNIDPEIKHYFNRKESDEFGSDLKAIDIQRGRDFGLPSYNDLRQFCGLPRANFWSDLANEISNSQVSTLQRLYATPDDVELSVGASLERHVPGALFGPTFLCIIGKQFLKTRIGDRFFFENSNEQSGFTPAQLVEIRKVSLASLFCNNALYLGRIQPNVFVLPNSRNYLKNCNEIPRIDLRKWQEL